VSSYWSLLFWFSCQHPFMHSYSLPCVPHTLPIPYSLTWSLYYILQKLWSSALCKFSQPPFILFLSGPDTLSAPRSQTPSVRFLPRQNYWQNYSSVCFNSYFFRQQVWRQGPELNCSKYSWI
jgi:hypothetical protein